MRNLTAPPSRASFVLPNGLNNPVWMTWLNNVFRNIYPTTQIKGYLKADLITANRLAAADVADSTGTSIIYVTDAIGGASTAYSDGTNWISHKTGAAV